MKNKLKNKAEIKDKESIGEFLNAIQKIASGDFSARVSISDNHDLVNGIAVGINMLAEELEAHDREKEDQTDALYNILEDVNEAKETAEQVKEALIESEDKFRLIAEISSDLIFQIDLDGVITYCSPAVERIIDKKVEKVVGTKFRHLINKAQLKNVNKAIKKVVDGEKIEHLELELANKNKTPKIIEISIVPIKKDEKMIGLQGIARDITDRKLVEEALRESEEKYRTLMDNLSDTVIEIDSQGTYTYVSPQIFDVFGFKPDEVVGKNMYEFIHPDDLEKTIVVTEEAIQGGKLLRFEYRSKHKDGHYIYQSGIGRIIKQNGDFKIVGVIRDITDKKRAEEDLNRTLAELERSNKELEQFAYIASHDLQEPIRMVASYLQLLERRNKDKLNSEAHEFIAYAIDGAKRMQSLINDLLAYSRVSTRGKDFKPSNSEEILDRVLSDLGLMIEDSGASVTHDKLPLLKVDDMQLGQIFQNLLGNALKFHGNGSPQVHVSADKQGNEWIFSVKDNGIGIDPQYGDRPFMIFQQLHTKDEYPGTGIGLAVCKRIVERHNGRIWYNSEPGNGTTFYFSIPIKESEKNEK